MKKLNITRWKTRLKFLTLGSIAISLSLPTASLAQDAVKADPFVTDLMNRYVTVSYALGANESCDIFKLGQYRALSLLRTAYGDALGEEITAESLQKIDKFEAGQKDWSSCPELASNAAASNILQNALLLADAVIAAPENMSGEPHKCRIADINQIQTRRGYMLAANLVTVPYANSPRKAAFDKARAEFAEQIDGECQNNKQSLLMQAAYDALLLSEETPLMANFYLPFSSPILTQLLYPKDYLPVGLATGPWRSRRGKFLGTDRGQGIMAYRTMKRDDQKTLVIQMVGSAPLKTMGQLYITQKGAFVASIQGDVQSTELLLSNGKKLPFEEINSASKNPNRTREFVLGTNGLAAISKLKDNVTFRISYRDAEGKTTFFRDWSKSIDVLQVQQQSLGDMRAALTWANAPILELDRE